MPGPKTEVVLPGGFQLGLGPKAYPPHGSCVLCLTLTDMSDSWLPNLQRRNSTLAIGTGSWWVMNSVGLIRQALKRATRVHLSLNPRNFFLNVTL